MAKKFGKFLGFAAITAAAVAGGMAIYKKFKQSDEDFDDFDDFDDDDFDDDFSDLDIENRGYTSLNPDDSQEQEQPVEDAEDLVTEDTKTKKN